MMKTRASFGSLPPCLANRLRSQSIRKAKEAADKNCGREKGRDRPSEVATNLGLLRYKRGVPARGGSYPSPSS